MNFQKLINEAKSKIIIVGILPVADALINNHDLLANKLRKNPDFRIEILHESESFLFNRSLYLETRSAKTRCSFQELQNTISRIQRLGSSYMFVNNEKEYVQYIEKENRLSIRCLNLWQSLQIIQIDDDVYTTPIIMDISDLSEYQLVSDETEKSELLRYINYITVGSGSIYQSTNGDECIQMYSRDDAPRGIFPRKAFYNTDFQRHSVWILIFNRKGELLLHRRNKKVGVVKDNSGLWDKSAGGHVDVTERNSFETAEREIVEELYLPDAEYTDYVTSDAKNFINLGEWIPHKREEEQVVKLFKRLEKRDYGYFFLRDSVKRTSRRMFIEWDDSDTVKNYTHKETKYISDIFLFIAPDGVLMDQKTLDDLSSIAAEERKLISVRDLFDQIEEVKHDYDKLVTTYADDLVFIADEYKHMLLQFSDHIKQIFIT